MKPAHALRVGELARTAGVNIQTLRYYERRGLLSAEVRSPGGHRLYGSEAVDRLRAIKAAQRLGFTLDEISELLAIGRRRHPTGKLSERAVAKLAEIDRRIADLQAVRRVLAQVIEAQCTSLTNCTCPESVLDFIGALPREA